MADLTVNDILKIQSTPEQLQYDEVCKKIKEQAEKNRINKSDFKNTIFYDDKLYAKNVERLEAGGFKTEYIEEGIDDKFTRIDW